jgi:hypothetical protein
MVPQGSIHFCFLQDLPPLFPHPLENLFSPSDLLLGVQPPQRLESIVQIAPYLSKITRIGFQSLKS